MMHEPLILSFFSKAVIALFVGSIIGYERETKNKPAGVKTHALIAFGAMAFTFLSSHMSSVGDPTRIAAQIVSGVGFLGAGTIFMSKHRVHGLTSAATVWVCAALGMLVGANYPLIALISVALLIVMFLIANALKIEENNYAITIEIEEWEALKEVATLINNFNLKIVNKKLERNDTLILDINYNTNPATQHLFLKRLFNLDGIGRILNI
jgi:putative Mg2+ transporter-C (MgtC) family protein